MAISSQDIIDAAFLSEKVYEANGSSTLGLGWTLLSRTELGLSGIQDGWDFNGEYLFDNWNAQGFVARKDDGTLAIVFRGSTLFDFSRGLGADFYDAVSAQELHYGFFEKLVDAAISYANRDSSIANVIVAGHSLGGAMAQLFEKNDANSNYSPPTFGYFVD